MAWPIWVLREVGRRLLTRRVPVPVPPGPRPVPAPVPAPRPMPGPRPLPPGPVPPGPIPGPVPGPIPGPVPGNPPVAGPEAPPIPESLTGEGYRAPDWAGDERRMGQLTRAENRKRRRERSCCHPSDFRTRWLSPHTGQDPNGSITFTDRDLERFGGFAAILRGVVYQHQVCGPQEYSCQSAAGTTAYPDGELSAQCWIREAKYQMPRPVSGFPEAEYVPPNQADRERVMRQFRRYGEVTNSPGPPARPCWHIGLEVIVSQRGGPVAYYLGLLRSNAIEGVVRWQPILQEGLDEMDGRLRDLE